MTDTSILLAALKRMLPSQFEEVFFHAKIPFGAIDPGAQNTRALQLITYADANGTLAELENAIKTVAPGVLKTCLTEMSAAMPSPASSTPSPPPPLQGEEAETTDEVPPKVLISYSHDSDAHRDSILELSNRLREDGIDCTIDQYLNGAPPEGWAAWMEKQIEQSDFVLVMCTPIYLQRFRREVKGSGRGVAFEGVVITQHLYESYNYNTKFLPMIPEGGDADRDVPIQLRAGNIYRMSGDYEKLYRVLTNQPEVEVPTLGKRKSLPLRNPN